MRSLSTQLKDNSAGLKVLAGESSNVDQIQSKIIEIAEGQYFTIDDPWDDYHILNADDPFTNLYLSHENYLSCSDDMVEEHYQKIKKFLDQIFWNMNSGIEFKSTYPHLDPESAMTKIKQARARLATKPGRENTYLEIIAKIKSAGKRDLDTLLETLLIDGVLMPDESKHYISRALTHKYDESEALGQLEERLSALKYVPAKPIPPDMSSRDRILNIPWMAPEKLKDFELIRNNPSEVNPGSIPTIEKIPGFLRDVIQEVAGKAEVNNVKETISDLGKVFLKKLMGQVRE